MACYHGVKYTPTGSPDATCSLLEQLEGIVTPLIRKYAGTPVARDHPRRDVIGIGGNHTLIARATLLTSHTSMLTYITEDNAVDSKFTVDSHRLSSTLRLKCTAADLGSPAIWGIRWFIVGVSVNGTTGTDMEKETSIDISGSRSSNWRIRNYPPCLYCG